MTGLWERVEQADDGKRKMNKRLTFNLLAADVDDVIFPREMFPGPAGGLRTPSKCQLVPSSFFGCLRRHPKAVTSYAVLAQLTFETQVGPGQNWDGRILGNFGDWRWGGQQ